MRYWWNRKFYFYKFKKIYEKQSTDYLYIFVKRINNKIINSTKLFFFTKASIELNEAYSVPVEVMEMNVLSFTKHTEPLCW